MIALVTLLLLPIGTGATDFGIVSAVDYLRFPVIAVDSAGIEQAPDSGHVLVWFEGEASANAASYTNRWTDAGAGSSHLDSVRYADHTYYYFVDQVMDIDNDEGNGVYTGVIILYTDGEPYPNPFSFTLAGDELADYWAEASRLDSTDVARAVWNAPSLNHTGEGRFGAYLDAPVSGVSGGSGAYSVTLVAFDTANTQTVSGVRLALRNINQSSLLALAGTGPSGIASVNLDAGDYLVSATAPGYIFATFHTLSLTGPVTDSIFGCQFDPGSPETPSLCRVYGYLYQATGEPENGVTVSAHLPAGVSRSGGLIISPHPTTATVDADGFFYLDLLPSTSLIGTPVYEFTINRTDGTILRKRLSVPDATNWQLTW
jgi:hypothetical protein